MPPSTPRSAWRRPVLVAWIALATAALAACGSSGSGGSNGSASGTSGGVTMPAAIGPAPTNAPTGSATLPAGTAAVSSLPTALGDILVDGSTGRTLYAYAGTGSTDPTGSGGPAAPTCNAACARLWTPYLGSHIGIMSDLTYRPGEFKLVARPGGGAKQLTVDGHLLYEYAPDLLAGQTKGQGLGGTWFAVAPDGSLITKKPAG